MDRYTTPDGHNNHDNRQTEHRLCRAIQDTGSHTSGKAFFSLKIPALRLAEIKVWWPREVSLKSSPVLIPVWGIILLVLCTITRPCSYSSVQLQNEKKPQPAGFAAFLRVELSNHICSGGYTRYGTLRRRLPRILFPTNK